MIKNILPNKDKKISWNFFLLGAGFMLIETKAITELALSFGSTWITNSIVITAILIMAFIANYVISKIKQSRRILLYGLLILALIAGILYANIFSIIDIPFGSFKLLSIIVLTLPLFFSGLIFSSELKTTRSITTAFSSNLLGAILGGFLEYNSMYFGFQFLYVIGIIIYLLAFYASLRVIKQT